MAECGIMYVAECGRVDIGGGVRVVGVGSGQ